MMIPVSAPLITERDMELVIECMKAGWISSDGPYLNEFEQKWSNYCHMNYGIAVNSGTSALQIAIDLLELQPNDEVIMPTFTIISCAQAVVYAGGKPVLVDSDPNNWQMDVSQIEDKITDRTRAILVVHTYGHPVDIDPILYLTRKYNLKLVEDAAEAHGAEYKGKRCGGFGDISIFSFYANKLITTGEGGMILVRDIALAEKAKALRNLCFSRERRFLHYRLGYNFRMTNIQAALGLSQLTRIDEIVAKKRSIAQQYFKELSDLPGIKLPCEASWAKNVYWIFGILVSEDTGVDGDVMSKLLAAEGIQTRPFFYPMHKQPIFNYKGLFLGESYPAAELMSKQGLYIPSGLTITADEIIKVSVSIHKIISNICSQAKCK
jgi:perosamine synthetase